MNQPKLGKSVFGKLGTYCAFILYPITASNLILIFLFKTARKRSGRILSNVVKKATEDGIKIIFCSVRIPFISLFTTSSGSRAGPKLVLGF